ncbi:MAG: YciI family protein [Candidatus Eremiobacteraeota bacterium]|nr:YciI family protein [Candidatus Eremiobacteraeota bacterium]
MRFVVLIEYTDLAARERALPDHRAYLKAAREQGTVVESGPFSDGKGGLYILNVRDEAAACAFVSADPYSVAGMRLTVREWQSSRDPD